MAAPKVFISYSHDSDGHQAWVLKFATDLRTNGVDAMLDKWDLAPGQDIVKFMQAGIIDSDRVLLVCTENYVKRAEAGVGGVGYERLIVTAELVENIETRRFVPVIRSNTSKRIPVFLGPRLYLDFTKEADYEEKLTELLHELHGEPASAKPPLGTNPFSGSAPAPTSVARAGPTGLTPSGSRLLDDGWFESNAAQATAGLSGLEIAGAMELRFALHDPVGKSQIELIDAVRSAQIKTFGWPIGIILDTSDDDYRPRPTSDGIRAEIAITERALSGERSYDYWTARTNGDFYLLQSLFEDQRSHDKLFFNTRMVRVAEAFMFAVRFYRQLGVADETRLSVRVTHSGMNDRELGSSSPTRYIVPRTAAEDLSQTEFVEHLGSLDSDTVRHVRQVLGPLFMLFDFMQFDDQIYDDVVARFIQGDVS